SLAIKERVTELDKHFGIRFPVYVLFTKCDLVAGFAEFFEDLGRAERDQVWGVTFPLNEDQGTDSVAAFESELDLLFRRLNERMLTRVSQEPEMARRALVHGFPKQMAALKQNLNAFLREVFQSSRYDTSPLLRGAYFTSGTQEGTPIDRLLGSLARTFQIDARALPQHTGGGKSYFITAALKKVAFQEANLAGTNRRVELQRAWAPRAAYAGIGGFVVVAIVAWVFAYIQNGAYIESVADSVATAEAAIAQLDERNFDPISVLPALDAARNIPGGYADSLDGPSWFGVGL